MIVDRIENAATYAGMGKIWAEAFAILQAYDDAAFAKGKQVTASGIKINPSAYETKSPEGADPEAHKRYADIQFLLDGEEISYYCPAADFTRITKEYDPDKDVYFGAAADTVPVKLEAGNFAVFFPQDGHAPGCICGKAQTVRKAVLKVPLD